MTTRAKIRGCEISPWSFRVSLKYRENFRFPFEGEMSPRHKVIVLRNFDKRPEENCQIFTESTITGRSIFQRSGSRPDTYSGNSPFLFFLFYIYQFPEDRSREWLKKKERTRNCRSRGFTLQNGIKWIVILFYSFFFFFNEVTTVSNIDDSPSLLVQSCSSRRNIGNSGLMITDERSIEHSQLNP